MTETIKEIEEIIGFDALYESMMKCARNVRWKSTTGYYLHNWLHEIPILEKDLKCETYRERKPKFFDITEPKARTIMSIHFRDRIYIRSLNDNGIYPQVAKSFILDNYACQKGKGTEKARDRMRDFLRAFHRKNGRNGYILKIDIKGYYPNMDHKFVKSMLKEYLDDEVYRLACGVIDFHPGKIGFNPGDQTIQNVGITALDKIDHYIKERLRIKYYIRYMDDFILIHEDKRYLESCLLKIIERLEAQGMRTHEKKTFIQPVSQPIVFLGFKYILTENGKVVILTDPKKIKHEKRKIKRMVKLVAAGKLKKHDVDVHFKAYKASVRYGNSNRLIYRLNRWYEDLWREQ